MAELATFTKKMVNSVRLLKGPHIRAESKETDGLQEVLGTSFIVNYQSAPLEESQLGRNVDGRFAE